MSQTTRSWLASYAKYILALLVTYFLIFNVALPLITGVDLPLTVVTSNSMYPTLRKGDLLLVVKADPTKLRVGDIIVFKAPWRDSYIVHRIIAIENSPHGIVFYTKGDNNAVPDPGYRTVDDIYGMVIFRIPYLGGVLDMLQTIHAKLILVGIIAAVLIYDYSKSVLRERDEVWFPEDETREEERRDDTPAEDL